MWGRYWLVGPRETGIGHKETVGSLCSPRPNIPSLPSPLPVFLLSDFCVFVSLLKFLEFFSFSYSSSMLECCTCLQRLTTLKKKSLYRSSHILVFLPLHEIMVSGTTKLDWQYLELPCPLAPLAESTDTSQGSLHFLEVLK